MSQFVVSINQIVWGLPTLIMILGVGFYLSLKTRFAQFRLFPKAIRAFFANFNKQCDHSGMSSYRALCTALSATVGTGNIAGVAGAIAIGGPGAVFWMWICALLGMVIKFAEATLAVRYRQINVSGECIGGPMYMIKAAMPKFSFLAGIYSFFGVIAAFGVGNATQINAVIGSVNSVITFFGGKNSYLMNVCMGIVLAAMILTVLLGGAKRIGSFAENLVPFAALGYLLLCCVVLLGCSSRLPVAFSAIVKGAFSPQSVTGGIIGSFFIALRTGASRGVFTNEAGMGTAAIAHASSNVVHPVEQGYMGIVEVFLDTIVMCTMTALVILCSGVAIPYGHDTGLLLTTQAFSSVLGSWVCIPVAIFICCFAFATVLGWGLYGIRCAQYLLGDHVWKFFVWIQAGVALVSTLLKTETIWMLAETVNGLMAIPNLVVLAYLAPELKRITFRIKNPLISKI